MSVRKAWSLSALEPLILAILGSEITFAIRFVDVTHLSVRLSGCLRKQNPTELSAKMVAVRILLEFDSQAN